MRCSLLLKQIQIHILVYRYKKPLHTIEYVNRIRRISTDLLTAYKDKFGTEFRENKKTLNELAIVRSKGLKNEIAGYITAYLRRELEELKEKESQTLTQAHPDKATKMEEQIIS